MGKISNSRGIALEFKPWTDSGYRIVKLQMVEELGGRIPEGNMYLHHNGSDEAKKLITEEKTGTIYISDDKNEGINFEIPIYITKRQPFQNILQIWFVCIPDAKFFTDLITVTYDDIESAINIAYPGVKMLRTEPDSGVSKMKEWQSCENSYNFLKKLCYSFKQNTVFSFGWEGLMIKDLCGKLNSFGKDENTSENLPEIGEGKVIFNMTPASLVYDKKLNHQSYNPWHGQAESGDDLYPTTVKNFTKEEPSNITSVMNYSDYYIVGKKYWSHVQNAEYNRNLMSGNLYSEFVAKALDMPNFKIGDVVKYVFNGQDQKIPFERYVVKSNELFWTAEDSDGEVDERGLRFSWTVRFIGLDKGKWNEDPNKEEDQDKKK